MTAESVNTPDDDTQMAARPARIEIPRGGPNEAEKAELRAALMALYGELARSSKDLADETLKGSGQDFKLDHMADFGSDNFEQDMSLSLLEGETELLQSIETAIRKIDGDEELPYGLCEACAQQAGGWDAETSAPWIPTGRLQVVPYALLCVAHQEAHELED